MYLVTIYDGPNDKTGTIIHSPYTNNLKLSNANVNLVVQGVSDMSFVMNFNNPGWGKIKPLKTLIKVVNVKSNKVVFFGRVLKPSQKMSSDGMFSVEYECESKLAYLNDSNQRHGEYHNITVRDFLRVILDNHNRQVDSHKRFKLGTITVKDDNDSLYRYLGYETTYATIKDKLIDRLGGFLVTREERDGTYLDYLDSVGEVKKTPIRLRTNLKDMQREINPLEVITRLVPLGATIQSEDEEATDASQARLTIAEVNNGSDYLDDLELQQEFEIIEGTVIFDDVTQANNLLRKGQQFLTQQKAAKVSYSVTPVDVSLIDASFDAFECGNWHQIINPVFLIDEPLQIIEQKIDINDPQKASLTIGDKHKTLTQYQIEANKRSRILKDLESKTISQSKRIGTLSVELQTTKKALQETQENMNNFEGSTTEGMAAITEAILTIDDAINNINEIVLGLQDIITVEEKHQMQEAIAKNSSDILTMKDQINDLTNRVNKLEEGGGGNS